ncbi:hypothetical protein FPE01S_01_14140 [Flavihumibacter petaseus NBRC 106054]|uniref:Serine aminopeptidase S33 domain-containing protein n=2 Tax=Flavihumibacter TaxID=1004301 RepID=A0A0E9MXU4_9BACT|nr:hypothetical protein FPE01S_01_14140 [Flavihumibacter petaseus NBRC 106054]
MLSCIVSVQSQTGDRPQTPHPPYPYQSDSLVYQPEGDSSRYGITVTKPSTGGPFASFLLITGSGPQDRDETILRHKPFAVLADFLTRQGYLVMRVDDRGVGQSNGNFAGATSFDFASDVQKQLAFLRSLPQVDKKRIGLIGHSEGGMIAPIVASRDKQIAYMILLAGPGVPIGQLMGEQNQAVLQSAGVDSLAALSYGKFFAATMPAVAAAPTRDSAARILSEQLNTWRQAEHPNRVFATTAIRNDSGAVIYQQRVLQQIYSPWFRTFLGYDPELYLEMVTCKVLALNGARDIQVLPDSNLEGIRKALAGSSQTATIEKLPGLNHLFQTCKLCTVQEYGILTETLSPVLLDRLADWLKKNAATP